jgi:ribose transport system permease protein
MSRISFSPMQFVQKASLIVAWMIVIAIFSGLQPSTYPTTSNFASIFGSQAFVAVLALGLIVTLRVGEFDLSIAATMTMGSVVLAVLDVQNGFDPATAVVLTLLVGASIGLTNGILVVVFGVDSFIATLGVATILQGIALWITNQETIVGVSNVFVSAIVLDRLFGIPLGFYYALGLMVALAYLFQFTVLGRRLLFVGRNREVARLSGIGVGRIKIGAFTITGILSAGAGILLTGTGGSADPTSGLSYLLPAYAAAFLGATTTATAEFTPVGTFVAVYFLVSGVTGLAIAGVTVFVQQIFYGGALILAVSASRLLQRGGLTRWARSRLARGQPLHSGEVAGAGGD